MSSEDNKDMPTGTVEEAAAGEVSYETSSEAPAETPADDAVTVEDEESQIS